MSDNELFDMYAETEAVCAKMAGNVIDGDSLAADMRGKLVSSQQSISTDTYQEIDKRISACVDRIGELHLTADAICRDVAQVGEVCRRLEHRGRIDEETMESAMDCVRKLQDDPFFLLGHENMVTVAIGHLLNAVRQSEGDLPRQVETDIFETVTDAQTRHVKWYNDAKGTCDAIGVLCTAISSALNM